MQSLDLYASIEEYLDFDIEVQTLHYLLKDIVLSTTPKTLIDIGCGQGEFCKLIANKNIEVLGVDLSQKQIDIANSKNIKATCIDIKDVKQRYDCATAVFDVVNYIDKDYIKSFLTHTYNLLNNDGYFIFDINSLYGFDIVAPGSLTIDIGEKFIAIEANFVENILYTDITVFTKESDCYKKDEGTIQQYFYTIDQLKDILVSIGFVVEEVIDFKLHDDFDENDKSIFICKKVI